MNRKNNQFISIIIYVHNDENRIEEFLNMVINIFNDNFKNYEIICVNDYSSDLTTDIIKKVAKEKHSNIVVINMSNYHGLELSMSAAHDLAVGDFVYEFDKTFMDYQPSLIMEIYSKMMSGYDVVSATPRNKRKFSSTLFYKLFTKTAKIKDINLSTETFRIISRRVINRINILNRSIPYRKIAYAISGLKISNIEYNSINEDKYTIDKQEKASKFSLAIDSLLIFTNIGYKGSLFVSLFMFLFLLCISLYTLISYCLSNPVEGWTSTILFLSLCFLCVFIMLTTIIKYLQLILNMIFKKQNYNFESIEKINNKQ